MEKELKEIYELTLLLQAKVLDLKNKAKETKETATNTFLVGQSGEFGNQKQSEK